MPQAFVQVDAFTAEPFAGNPAAVCMLARPADERWMQAVAREMNLSETAFLYPDGDAWRLRWFTPTVEVDLCGHATLAAAHVLWEEGHLPPDAPARFHTHSGRLGAVRRDGWVELDFPAEPALPAKAPAGLLAALGVRGAVARNRLDYLVQVDDEAMVRRLTPDLTRLRRIRTRGVIVTARATAPPYDFVSRFFAPAAGVDEDPVTGSAFCALGPWWAERLGRDTLTGFQASARGGVVRVHVRGARVGIAGQAVTVLRGELVAPAAPA
jgi:predicted PhzF superfamily epimerase YddE/YHI9